MYWLAQVLFRKNLFLFAVTLLHAALRLRNMKNKMANTMEEFGVQTTPMGLLLVKLEMVEDKLIKSKKGAKIIDQFIK